MSQRGPYTGSYYAIHDAGSARSARIVLSYLYRWYMPASVIDVGCGQGAWLAAAETLGSRTLVGLDGPWVDSSALASPNIRFQPTDLEADVVLSERYDLCVSVEVAEHLAPDRATPFVGTLCRASNVVLFSAAIPHQSGDHHVNLRWPSYWARLFDEHDFECFDSVRPVIWRNDEVDWWYRQNVLLFAKRGSAEIGRFEDLPSGQILDVVHPAHLASLADDG